MVTGFLFQVKEENIYCFICVSFLYPNPNLSKINPKPNPDPNPNLSKTIPETNPEDNPDLSKTIPKPNPNPEPNPKIVKSG